MKIIDLLNKIANGEVIKKFKYEDISYNDIPLFLYEELGEMCNTYDLQKFLNDKVEIIEEKKILEKLDYCEENTFIIKCKENSYLTREEIRLLDSNFKELGNKINELINKVNELDKRQ